MCRFSVHVNVEAVKEVGVEILCNAYGGITGGENVF